MNKLNYISYKILLYILLRLPDLFYSFLFTVFFPIYKTLHKKRAYGRVEQHLELAKKYVVINSTEKSTNLLNNNTPLLHTSARDVFRGIFWDALDSYRGLARQKNTTSRIVFENEHIIRDAITQCAAINAPIAAISIHQGPFELLHRSLCRYSEHVHLITDSVGDTTFREVLKNLRSDPHLTEYHPNETGRLIRELFRTKGILAMVVDQGRHTKGNTVSLFGRPSTLYLRLPKKVNDMGAGIVIFRSWTKNRHIVIRFEKYYPPRYDAVCDKKANPASNSPLIESIAKEIEKWIAEHPSEWSWNYHGNFTTD